MLAKWLEFFAASLVLGTFLVKEIKLEEWKRRVTKINTVEAEYAELLRYIDVKRSFARVQSVVKEIRNTSELKTAHEREVATLEADLSLRADMAELDIEAIKGREAFVEKLKRAEELKSDQERRVQNHVGIGDSDYVTAEWEYRRLLLNQAKAYHDHGAPDPQLGEKIEQQEGILDGFEHMVTSSVQNRYEDERNEAERKSKLLQRWSWVLYAIGWLVALVAKLLPAAK